MPAARIVAALTPAIVALGLLASVGAQTTTITLSPGRNVVTWNGDAPYAIADFADTPVTKVHRWDAVRQEWLSRFVGRDGGRLPELHLLPRVQYVLVAEGKYELDVPDPIAGIDPYAALSPAAAPDDPLRFEAYWPNEDSPLEDLVVLRSEDERLSVRAEIAGGSGGVSVWWMIDGRVNHVGLASDEVDLTPGGHDHGRLYAVDGSEQVAVVELPRVVRLPPTASLNIPQWQAGVDVYLNYALGVGKSCQPGWDHLCTFSGLNVEAALAAIDWIADAGFDIVRIENFDWNLFGDAQVIGADTRWRPERLAVLDRIMDRIDERGLDVLTQNWSVKDWASRSVDRDGAEPLNHVAYWPPYIDALAARYPQIRYWQFVNEPNLDDYYLSNDPYNVVRDVRNGALAVWYRNPQAIVVGPGMFQYGDSSEFLHALYDAGLEDYVDVLDIHLYHSAYDPAFGTPSGCADNWPWTVEALDRYLAVMRANGDGAKPLWSTEIGIHTNFVNTIGRSEEEEAICILDELKYLEGRPEVNAAFIHNFHYTGSPFVGSAGLVEAPFVDGDFTARQAYWAVREYLTGKPPP